MDFQTLEIWLAGQSHKKAKACQRQGVIGSVLCPIVLLLTWGMIFGILELFSRRHDWEGNTILLLVASFMVLPLLFLGNWLISLGKLYEEHFIEGSFSGPAGRYSVGGRLAILLLIAWILFTGPQIFQWARKGFREARKWREQDTHGCAAVIWVLATRHKRVPIEEVERELPWVNLDVLFPQLMRIPGFLHLPGPPEGFGLNDTIRAAIRTGGDLGEEPVKVQLS